MADEPGYDKGLQSLRRKGGRTLRQLTLLITSVYILAGLAGYLLLSGSQNRLLEKTREKLLLMHATTVSGNAAYALDFLLDLGRGKLEHLDADRLLHPHTGNDPYGGKAYIEETLAAMIGEGFSGLEGASLLLPSPSGGERYIPIASAGTASLREPPPNLLQAVQAGRLWVWTGEDYSETPDGRNLVVAKQVDLNGKGLTAYFLAARSMDSEIATIDRFCESKRSQSRRNLALLGLAFSVGMSLLTYAFLNLLVRRRITRPIGELQRAATEVMSGNLDVRLQIRKGEEFAGLKQAFNTMVENLKAIISLPFMEDGPRLTKVLAEEGARGGLSGQEGRGVVSSMNARSRTLFAATLFVSAVFLLSVSAQFLVFNHWQNRLIDAGIQESIYGMSEYFSNDSSFIRHVLDPLIVDELKGQGVEELSSEEQYLMILEKRITPYQHYYDLFCRDLVEKGALGLEAVMVILSGPGIPGGSTVVVSDDESRVYGWRVPDYLMEAIEEDTRFLYFERGIAELGLEGEQVMAVETFPYLDFKQAYVGVRSLREEVAEMTDFFEEERRSIFLRYTPLVILSLALFFLLAFLGLRFLLRRNITRPVEELSERVEKVMEGDLEETIPVHEGEDVEALQRVFRELVDSFRRIISRSLEGE